jgi:Tfp pilus assembly protein PilW
VSLLRRFEGVRGDAGLTMIELLVASAMGVILMGAVSSLIVGALRSQPQVSRKAADVTTARWVMERFTRELRGGVVVNKATPSSVSFQTYVRSSTCGGTGTLPSATPSIKCQVTYTCAGSSCTRIESVPNVFSGTPKTVFTGLNNSSSVFTYSPNTTTPTYVGITVRIPSPGSAAATTVSDGASLRNATLAN